MVTTVVALPRQDKTARSEKSGKVGQFSFFPFLSVPLLFPLFISPHFLSSAAVFVSAPSSLFISLSAVVVFALSLFLSSSAPSVCVYIWKARLSLRSAGHTWTAPNATATTATERRLRSMALCAEMERLDDFELLLLDKSN